MGPPSFFGISLPVVQVAGGLLLTVTGWSLLSGPYGEANADRVVATTERDWLQQSFYTLPLPRTVGPSVQIVVNGVKSLKLL